MQPSYSKMTPNGVPSKTGGLTSTNANKYDTGGVETASAKSMPFSLSHMFKSSH